LVHASVQKNVCTLISTFVSTFPFGAKIDVFFNLQRKVAWRELKMVTSPQIHAKQDTIKIDVFFNLQRKVAWRELKMVTSPQIHAKQESSVNILQLITT